MSRDKDCIRNCAGTYCEGCDRKEVMNDEVKFSIEQKAIQFINSPHMTEESQTARLKAYTAGANEFYNKGNRDGYNRALTDTCAKCNSDPAQCHLCSVYTRLLKLKESANETPTK